MSEYAQIQRLLVDAKSEARARACAEITSKTAATFSDVPPEEAYRMTIRSLQQIEQQFVRNAQPAFRRGGMSSVKATVAGVPPNKKHNPEFIKMCADIVLPCLADVDQTVRIAALETAHEMMRKFQSQLFTTSFMELFRGLLAIMSEKDKKCLQLVRELSNTVREFVTGSESSAFSPEMFVSFLTEAMEPLVNPCGSDMDQQVVQWLLEWISHVYDLPNHELVLQLPRFLSHLFYLISRCPSTEAERLLERSLQDAKRAHQQGLDINIHDLLTTSVDCVTAIDIPATRRLALEWTFELLKLGGFKMLPLSHNILEAVLPQLGAKDVPIRIAAQNANGLLQQLLIQNESGQSNISNGTTAESSPPVALSVEELAQQVPALTLTSPLNTSGEPSPTASNAIVPVGYYPVLQAIMSHLDVKAKEETRVASLEWFLLIHGVRPDVIRDHFETVFESILSTLGDHSEHVMHKSIEALHIIAGEFRFAYFIDRLLVHFEHKAPVLLPKAPTIIKQLQLRYQGDQFESCEKLYLKISEILPTRQDLRFVSKFVIVLNTMLLTSKEMMPLREVLRGGVGDERARAAFLGLYRCWCYDVTAAIALCLVTTAYSQAYRLIVMLGSSEMSPQALVQVDRLVQLIESPVFAYLRIALLQPTKNAALVKSLFGLQMILPQASQQYKTLSARLKAVPSVAQLEIAVESKGIGSSIDIETEEERLGSLAAREAVSVSEWLALEERCLEVQRQVTAYELSWRTMGMVHQ